MVKPPTEWGNCERPGDRDCECATCSPHLYHPLFPDIEEPRVVDIRKERRKRA